MFRTRGLSRRFGVAGASVALFLIAVEAHVLTQQGRPAPAVERLGDNQLRVGRVRIDLAAHEVRVPARINAVTTIEFFANKRGGIKSYESALTLDTDGVTFNTALLLLGLERPRSMPVAGAPNLAATIENARVQISIEIPGPPPQTIRADRLMFDKRTQSEVPESTWVYTGSGMVSGRYMADLDGTLIGFMHRPDPVIERIDTVGIGRYGQIVLNPNLGLRPDQSVIVIIKKPEIAAQK